MTTAELLEHLRTLRLQPPATPAARGEAAQALFLASQDAFKVALAHRGDPWSLRFEDGAALAEGLAALAGDLLDGRDPELETVLRLEDMARDPHRLAARVGLDIHGYAVFADFDTDGVVTIMRSFGAVDRGRWSPEGRIVDRGGSAYLGDEVLTALEAALRRALGMDDPPSGGGEEVGGQGLGRCAESIASADASAGVDALGEGPAQLEAGRSSAGTSATTAGETAESGPDPLAAGGNPALSDDAALRRVMERMPSGDAVLRSIFSPPCVGALVKLGLVEILYGVPSYARITDLGRRVLGGPPLSDPQAAMLREIEQGTLRVRGRGAAATMRALRAKGLVDDANELTEAGQRACAAAMATPPSGPHAEPTR